MASTPRAGRAGLAVAAVAGLGASFLLASSSPAAPARRTAPPPADGTPPLRLANAALTVPGSCDALLDSYVRRGVERVGPYGWDFPVYAAMEGDGMAGGAVAESAPAPAPRPAWWSRAAARPAPTCRRPGSTSRTW